MFEGVCEADVAAVQHADPFALAAALATLSEADLMELSAEAAECVIAATQRVSNAMAARQAVAIDRYADLAQERFDAGRSRHTGERTLVTETAAMLAPILRIAPRTMASRVEAARWGGLLERTSALAWAGDLEPARIAAITRAASSLGFDDLVEFEARLYHRDLTDLACSQVKARALKIANRLASGDSDPDPVLPRWVRVHPHEKAGTTRWEAVLPADRSQRMWAAIQTLAAEYRRANPALTLEQARADAFTDLLLGNASVSTTVTIVLPADHAPDEQSPTAPATANHPDAAHPPAAPHTAAPATAEPDTAARTPAADRTAEQATAEQATAEQATAQQTGAEQAGAGWASGEPDTERAAVAVGWGAGPKGQTADSGPPSAAPAAAEAGSSNTDQPGSDQPDTGRSNTGLSNTDQPYRGEPAARWGARLPRARSAEALWADIHWVEQVLCETSEFETHVGGALSQCLRVDVNPFLHRDATGAQVWFVPGPVFALGIGCLLPAQLVPILADPDIRVRLARAHPDTGAVAALDERTYRPGAALARLVRARDGTCRFPGCATPADKCHLDHVIRYPDGPTKPANLQSLCANHHGFKHHAGWTVTMTEDGICTWSAPNGRSHTTHPHAIHDHAA